MNKAFSRDPFPDAIPAEDGAILVEIADFAVLPISGDPGDEVPEPEYGPARMMMLLDEPSTCRLFVNDMRGPLYSVSYDGDAVELYLDLTDPRWDLSLAYHHHTEVGFQGFAFHPQFNRPGTPGFGKFYTIIETDNRDPEPDFTPMAPDQDVFDTILLEWTTPVPQGAVYVGGPPRELLRIQQPRERHNGGQISFNPNANPGEADYGNLYVSLGDGEVKEYAQHTGYIYGSILRIDPLGSSSANGQYGIPEDNPFVGQRDALGEIYAYGLRHPQRFGWDTDTGDLLVADIGESVVDEINIVEPGANYG